MPIFQNTLGVPIYILVTPRSATATTVDTEAKLLKVRVINLLEMLFKIFFCDGISPISLYPSISLPFCFFMLAVLAYKK